MTNERTIIVMYKLNYIVAHPFDTFSGQVGNGVDEVCWKVVKHCCLHFVDDRVHFERAIGIPHHFSGRVFHPCIEAYFAEAIPRQWIHVTRWTVVNRNRFLWSKAQKAVTLVLLIKLNSLNSIPTIQSNMLVVQLQFTQISLLRLQ